MDLSDLKDVPWQTWTIIGGLILWAFFYIGGRYEKTWATNPFTMLRVKVTENPFAVTINWRWIAAIIAIISLGIAAFLYERGQWMMTKSVAVAAMLLLALIFIVFAIIGKIERKRAALLATALVLAAVAIVYHANIIAIIQDAPNQTAAIWEWAYPILGTLARLALTIAVVSLAIAGLKGIPSLKEFGDRAFALGALILGTYIVLAVIWKYDGSRHAYASAPPEMEAAILPPNTSASCPGTPVTTSLTSSFEEVNPHGCFSYWRVDAGRVILSGAITEKEVGPEGADLLGWVFYKARAKNGYAQLSYINCAGPKHNLESVDCN